MAWNLRERSQLPVPERLDEDLGVGENRQVSDASESHGVDCDEASADDLAEDAVGGDDEVAEDAALVDAAAETGAADMVDTVGDQSIAAASEEGDESEVDAGPAAADEDEPWQALTRIETGIAAGFERLMSLFENRLSYDRVKEKQIDALHAEVQKHRGDLVAKATRPLAVGVIRLHDDIGKTVEALRRKEPATLTPERCLRIVEGFQEDLEIVLEQNGVRVYREAGEAFDARRQTAVKSEPATDSAEVGCVAQRLRPGFERGEEILRKERVVVYGPMVQSPETRESAGEAEAARSVKENEDV